MNQSTYQLDQLLTSIHPASQHYQGAALNRLDAFFNGAFFQLVVLGAGIEDDARRLQVQNIIVILLLVLWVQVQGNCMHIPYGYMIRIDLHLADLSFAFADGDHLVLVVLKFAHGQVTITCRVGRRT